MEKDGKIFGFNRNVFVTGLVSLFMDMSSEMIYPLVPLFLANVIGANKSLIGLIEGIAESTASLLRVFSGWISDKLGTRKWLMAAGYGTSVLSRPLIAAATTWEHILTARFIDRFGKGVRVAPRDALIAESTDRTRLGRAFGLQRAMDTLGAVIGPGIAFLLLGAFSNNYRLVFWASVIPGIIAVALIIFFISEKRKTPAQPPKIPLPAKAGAKRFERRFKFFILIAALFALGNSSDAFLILRAQQLGVSAHMIPMLYLVFNLVYSLSAIPAGIGADRFGKKRFILLGFIIFSFVYYGFATAEDARTVWILFGLYGIFMGLTEGVQKAFLSTIIPEDLKATAFGIFNSVVGLAMLPASLIGGWLWDHVSPAATFYYGAATAVLSALLFIAYMITTAKTARAKKPR